MTQLHTASTSQSQIESQHQYDAKPIETIDLFDYTSLPTRICNRNPRIYADPPSPILLQHDSNYADDGSHGESPDQDQNRTEIEDTLHELDISSIRQEKKLFQMESQLKQLKDFISSKPQLFS